MELRKHIIRTSSAVLFSVCAIQPAISAVIIDDPSYFVRPALRVSAGEIIDGIRVNSETEATLSQGVSGYSESTVNLSEGTVKMYSSEYGSTLDGLQTFGSFGERVTIKNGAGSSWDVGFDIEGFLEVYAGAPLIPGVDTSPGIFYDVGIAVYNAGEVSWNNFVPGFNDSSPVLYEYSSAYDSIDAEAESSFYDLFTSALGSVEIASDYEVYDIFAFTNVIVNSDYGDGLEAYDADFLHTASFNMNFADGVDAYSSSGDFMGLAKLPVDDGDPSQIPEPESLLLFASGIALFFTRRKLIVS
ncbi:PEP-CTERM sorting domain-containing protein [Aliiglaciecola sp. 3_MG-2023]|uniref:PEP-CTERM sorting domain-containing protein n=1 Tax=Aliiglaciecola TaxID=1406885 RepID=UPI001C09ED66|nr:MULTISPECIES: PEP-CTERM sorting domain-containing protein [Aliiglaciecola]MBU2876706.1 PEP-CTERM sorting domain-containing protein [Aliiglaciecola lipolytica]MDO6693756.1 PEP-CTERM sorting domain-containing protein [Aliiglaciecola sp. 3_MG-2023]MDO6710298.1 PEP-CTERM sorting domain-containing protein [Aliiglaciecola sp. 2_MG-2023]MDO6751446.1 PEP-CTERM sorting domain-containing protein [Aliiglaciecola sp. 1_MG-2023]